MIAKTITYSKLKNLGDYENEKVEVVIELEPGETATEAFENAKSFVEAKLNVKKFSEHSLQLARQVLENPDYYTGVKVKEAQALIDEHAKSQSQTFNF